VKTYFSLLSQQLVKVVRYAANTTQKLDHEHAVVHIINLLMPGTLAIDKVNRMSPQSVGLLGSNFKVGKNFFLMPLAPLHGLDS